jgi:hypothetical protein
LREKEVFIVFLYLSLILWRGEGVQFMRISPLPSALLVAVVILLIPALTLALSASKVTLNFMCPCGSCDEALSTCECPSSDGYRSQIAGMVGSGYTEEQIIQNFKGQFGPSVLISNAALAPNSGGLLSKVSTKKSFGIILLLASFSLVAFSLGKYMNAGPSPAPARRRKKSSPRASGHPGKEQKKRDDRPEKRFRDGVDNELLDDYDHE